ncbi:insulin-like growth factor-binding protein 5 [Protopterus annectens]|uniref:insulin-like growth factor-binding protein 5 n=1 Tax=Protopterus annectens TaxID=7888 RepID=UPI001CF9FBDA|nr:insulin-like growth factor-binding protein 5 [Protopterus annectens]
MPTSIVSLLVLIALWFHRVSAKRPDWPECPSCEVGSREPVGAKAGTDSVRGAGEFCGVYTPTCARGLRCVPRAGDRTPLHSLLRGRGVCRKDKGGKNRWEYESQQPGSNEKDDTQGTIDPMLGGESFSASLKFSKATEESVLQQWPKYHHSTKISEGDSNQISLDTDPKQETETAPCRQHLDLILQDLKHTFFRTSKDIYIPNCDAKGFYRRKQCRSSKGPKRGICWCVDRDGNLLSGSEGTEGTSQCQRSESD